MPKRKRKSEINDQSKSQKKLISDRDVWCLIIKMVLSYNPQTKSMVHLVSKEFYEIVKQARRDFYIEYMQKNGYTVCMMVLADVAVGCMWNECGIVFANEITTIKRGKIETKGQSIHYLCRGDERDDWQTMFRETPSSWDPTPFSKGLYERIRGEAYVRELWICGQELFDVMMFFQNIETLIKEGYCQHRARVTIKWTSYGVIFGPAPNWLVSFLIDHHTDEKDDFEAYFDLKDMEKLLSKQEPKDLAIKVMEKWNKESRIIF